jgi:hypothetical protein
MATKKARANKWESTEATTRVHDVRMKLMDLGFRGLATGPFGLPSYDKIEAFGKNCTVVYLIYSFDGSWDVLTQVCEKNDTEATFAALKAIADKSE